MTETKEGNSWKHLTQMRLICFKGGVRLNRLKPGSGKEQRARNLLLGLRSQVSGEVWQARCRGEDLRFWGAMAPADQGENAATCEHMSWYLLSLGHSGTPISPDLGHPRPAHPHMGAQTQIIPPICAASPKHFHKQHLPRLPMVMIHLSPRAGQG